MSAGIQNSGPTADPQSVKARLFGEDSGDRLRKQLAKARFLEGLADPTGGVETNDDREGATEPVAEALVVEPVRIGRFSILQKLGEGGMGVVYAAYDEQLDRKVALKLLRSDLSRDERGRARMQREAQALARLSHPNVVQVHEVGEWRDHEYVAMEFVDGLTLRSWLDREERSWQAILEVMIRAGRGLEAAHAAGLVHRDFKPANLIVGHDGRPRVLDFGLARAAGDNSGAGYRVSDVLETHEQTRGASEFVETNEGTSPSMGRTTTGHSSSAFDKLLTVTGAVLGTPAYMAPEQHLGERATELSDQFSFCLVLYEALFGQRPYVARTRQQYAIRVTEGDFIVPGPDSGVPGWLRQAVCRGLAPVPADRWPSMAALLEELGRDRSRGWKRAVAGSGLAASLALVYGFGGASPEAPKVCQFDGSSIADSWGEESRSRVRAAFSRVELPGAASVLEQTERELDDYADALVSARRDACQQRELERSLTDTQYELQTGCLQQREAQLATIVSVLADADADVVRRSSDLLGGLGDISMCARVDLLERGVPVPKDEVSIAGIAKAREDIAKANAMREVGRQQDAVALASSVRRRAELLDYAPLLGEVALLEGNNAQRARDYDVARERLIEAAHIAEITDHAELSTAAWLSMSTVAALNEVEPDLEFRMAEAAVERLGARPADRFALSMARCVAHYRASALDAALAECSLAVEIAEAGFVGDQAALVDALAVRAGVSIEAGHAKDARADLERALAERGDVDDPQVLEATFDLAGLEVEQGELDHAEVELKRVLLGFERMYGPRSMVVGHARLLVARIAMEREEFDAAEEEFERVLDILHAEHPDHAWALDGLASLHVVRGEHEAAQQTLRRALEHSLSADAADQGHAAYLRVRLARQLIELGRHEDALVELELASQVLDGDTPSLDLAGLLILRARAQDALGRKDRALVSLERAVEIATPDCTNRELAARARVDLARLQRELGLDERAEQLAREASALVEPLEGLDADELRRAIAELLAP